MQTELIWIDREHMSLHIHKMERAGKILRGGGLVAFPTETVYGLGADALNEEAAGKIYKAKGRPSDATYPPPCRISSRAISSEGIRTATVDSPPVVPYGTHSFL